MNEYLHQSAGNGSIQHIRMNAETKMKRITIAVLVCMLAAALTGCTGTKEKDVSERIRESAAAKLIRPDGSEMYVDGEISLLRSFADLRLKASPVEPADQEGDWLYRIIFDPAEKVTGTDEIQVSFHREYVQIDTEYYLPEEGVSSQSILDWAEGKFEYFFKNE